MSKTQTLFDSARIARYRARAKKCSADHAFLRDRVFGDILLRLDSITRTFDRGVLVSPFALNADTAPDYLEQKPALPVPTKSSLDLILSLLHLHVDNYLPATLRATRQSLRPDGLFLGAIFGERTLHELRHALLSAESEHGGAQARIIPFADIRSLGDLMQRAGFALPVIDVDRVTVRYSSLSALMHDLRGMGESNPLSGPVRPLRRDVLLRAEEIYRQHYGDKKGRIAASFEIVHLCGWAPHESQQQPLKPGSAQISLSNVLGRGLKHKTPEK